jgi:serine/threonine protein phosphatase PrpC
MFIGNKAIARGSDHTRNGENIPCQDAASFTVIEYGRESCASAAIAVVADGHGSPAYFRSDIGSFYIVSIAKGVISAFLAESFQKKTAFYSKTEPGTVHEEALKKLEKDIFSAWQKFIGAHFAKTPITPDEEKHCQKHQIKKPETKNEIFTLYGSTLVAVVIAKDFWFNIQLGDGWCVVFDSTGKGKGTLPYSHNNDNKTDSLCQSDALNRFKHKFGFQKIAGAFVMTDGVTESFPSGEPGLLDWLNTGVFDTFIKEPENFEEQLQTVIEKRAKVFGDDGAIVGVFDYGMAVKALIEHEVNKTKDSG